MSAAKPSANSLRHRITLQSRSSVNDGFGQETLTWSDVLTCFASIEPTAGTSQVVAEAQVDATTHTIFIRYRPNITARMRAMYGTRIFEIESVIDVEERHFWLQLECTEGLTAG